MKGNVEEQVKSIQTKKRLQELAGIKVPTNNSEAENLWKELQQELTTFIKLVKAEHNE